ncbi:MAG: hypothetical protein IOC52_05410 [Methylobacterium sp.]|nr:hypothetical protein [Methylobacterium sp.]
MTDDIPLQVAAASAALVHDKWLPGLKEAEAAALVLELPSQCGGDLTASCKV